MHEEACGFSHCGPAKATRMRKLQCKNDTIKIISGSIADTTSSWYRNIGKKQSLVYSACGRRQAGPAELSAGLRYIYGPAHPVKGLSRGKTRFGTDAVIYPYMDSSRPASGKLMMSDSEPRAYIRPLVGERPPGPDVLRSLSSQRPHGIDVPRI